MSTSYFTTKRSYKHLSEIERGQIYAYLKAGKKPAQIAKLLGRHRSTISREIERGTAKQVRKIGGKPDYYEAYFPDTGQRVYEEGRDSIYYLKLEYCSTNFLKEFYQAMKAKPRVHSVDSFVEAYKREHPDEVIVSTKTLYNYIQQGLLEIKPIDLPRMVRKKPRTKARPSTKKHLGTSIEERPESINNRSVEGHWEIDLVIGKKTKGESVVLTLVERKSRYALVTKLADKQAETVNKAVSSWNREYHFKSITADNGSEFAELTQLENEKLAIFYAHAYSSHERGSNENFNGLLREYFPKGTSFNDVSDQELAACVKAINSRPRRLLDYQSAENRFALGQSTPSPTS